MIRSLLLAACVSASLAFADDSPPKTGNYTTTFTQRSPLSALKTMTTRMRIPKDSPDYDPSGEKWLVHVPANYSPDKPMGLVVQLIFKDKDNYINAECCKLLDERNMAFACRHDGGGAPVAKAGEALDAAYNLQQLYKIDPTRLYLFYWMPNDNIGEIVGLQLFTGYPDVWSGAMINNVLDFWAPIRAANGNIYENKVLPPPPQYRAAGAKHPLVLEISNPDTTYTPLLAKAWTSQGYKFVKAENVDVETTHYPNFKTEWFASVLDFLDQHKPAPPATRPTTIRAAAK